MFLRVFKHLLPRAEAWRLVVGTPLRRFFDGLSTMPSDARDFVDEIWADVFPQTTRELDEWEQSFALTWAAATEQDRRDRLDARWKAKGGQDPKYIQDTLQARGFDVYVHEWWVPGTEPPLGVKAAATPRNPFDYLDDSSVPAASFVQCGEPLAQCGESEAQCGNAPAGAPRGYLLVNKIETSFPGFVVLCGEPLAQCGEPEAQCGNHLGFSSRPAQYYIPVDPAAWPYFLYLGGETFPDLATVSAVSQDEFEALCLQICPAQQWLGMLVEYS
jgi:hypothetical protein